MTKKASLRPTAVLAVSFCAAAIIACGSTKETKQSPPYDGTYSIVFPSTAFAVATDNVQVFVFDGSVATNGCATLVQKRKSRADLPPTLVTLDPTPTCSLAHATGGQFTVSLETVSVLVVAERGAEDLLIGCAVQSLAADQTDVAVTLTFASSSTSTPTTSCTTLADHCNGKC
jgi:hypothetical protein